MENSMLYKKILGCYAGSSIGASMGAAVEWIALPDGGYKAVEAKLGWVEDLLAWQQKGRVVRYWNGPRLRYFDMDCPAGMTEDGAELKYLTAMTIVEKQGRIDVNDLAESWRKNIVREHIGYLVNPHIVIFLDRLNAGNEMTRLNPRDVGTGSYWPGMVDVQMMISPIGIINAGDPGQAAQDAMNVGSIMQSRIGFGLDLAAAIAAAVAEGFKPNATIDSVVEAAKAHVALPVQEVIDEAIDLAKQYPDLRAIRDPFFKKYSWLPAFDGMEVLSEALACFYIAKGDAAQAIIGGANFGRDTDCISCVAGAIAGAFSGSDALRADWIDTVESALTQSPYTMQKNSENSLRDVSKGLYNAVLKNQERVKAQFDVIDAISATKP